MCNVMGVLTCVQGKSMLDFYQQYWVPYATVLTDMEREGIQVH